MTTKTVRLGDLLEVQSGFAFKKEFFSDRDGVPLIRIRDLQSDTTETRFKGEFRDDFLVSPGDLLIGMDGTFRCYRWRGPRALLNQRVCRLQKFRPNVLPEYVFYGIQPRLRGIEDRTAFATVKHISAKQILSIELPLPSIAKQRRIVDFLSRAEGILRLQREARAVAADLTRALFVSMFGDPIRNPMDFPTLPVEELCDLVRGSSPRPQGDPRYFCGPVPRLMIADITRDGTYVTPRIDSLTLEGATKSRPMKVGEVVMAVSGAVGLPAILAVDSCIHDGFVGFRSLSDKVTSKYFYYFLVTSRYQTSKQAVGATFQNLNTEQIRKWRVPIPPLKDQVLFSERETRIESAQRLQRNSLQLASETFESLLQREFAE